MKTLIYSCQKATELVEKHKVSGLTIQERIRLNIHLSMCSQCKAYSQQSELLEQALEILISDQDDNAPPTDMKERIQKKLSELKKKDE